DEPMELFQGPARVVAEPGGQPVQQLRMRGPATHFAEVVWRLHQATAEMIMPHTVHYRTPGQRIVRVRQPAGERRASPAFIMWISDFEFRRQRGDACQCAGRRQLNRLDRKSTRLNSSHL